MAGLENQRFDVVLSTPSQAAPCKGTNCGCTDEVCHSHECLAEHAAAIAGGTFVKQQAAVTELKRWFMNPETGMLVQTVRGPWVRYVDVMEALAAFEAKKEGA